MTNGIENEPTEQEVIPTEAKSCDQLYFEYKERCEKEGEPKGDLLDFNTKQDIRKITPPFSTDNTDTSTIAVERATITFNPSPIIQKGPTHLFVRRESCELDSEIVLHKEDVDGHCAIDEEISPFPGQDPFDCGVIQEAHIFGNVVVWPDLNNPDETHYKTVFRRYKENFSEITDENGKITEPFAFGPEKMKDIRLVDRENGKIGVLPRPQKENFGGLGKIGYFEIDSLDELEEALAKYDAEEDQSTLIQGICIDAEWAGANQVWNLGEDQIGVFGHIARSRPKNPNKPEGPKVKDYYGITFEFNPETRQASNVQMVITSRSFPVIEPTKTDLGEVYFMGGVKELNKLGPNIVYGAVADEAGTKASIKYPFSR